MEKQKRWQFFVILAVCVLTLYNILPTIIFYSKPLHQPVDEQTAMHVAKEIAMRVNSLEQNSCEWIGSFCKLLNVHPTSIQVSAADPSQVFVEFPDEKQSQLFAKFLPRAGGLVPFVPAQLMLLDDASTDKRQIVLRQVGIRLNEQQPESFFRFTKKEDNGQIADFYFTLTADRFSQIATTLAGTSPEAEELQACVSSEEQDVSEQLVSIAKKMLRVSQSFGPNSTITNRYLASFTQTELPNGGDLIPRLVAKMEADKKKLELKRQGIAEEKRIK